MQEMTLYQVAIEATKRIVETSGTQEESKQILDLVAKLIELRWSIPQKQS